MFWFKKDTTVIIKQGKKTKQQHMTHKIIIIKAKKVDPSKKSTRWQQMDVVGAEGASILTHEEG